MSDQIICTSCGFHNAADDEFCGSCGAYLAWDKQAGSQTTAAAPSPTVVPATGAPPGPPPPPPGQPAYAPPPQQTLAPAPPPQAWAPPPQQTYAPPPPPQQAYAPPRQAPPDPMRGGPPAPGVPCWNCGLVNAPGRAFCQRCGQRIDVAVGTVSGSPPRNLSRRTAAASNGGGGHRGLLAVSIVLVAIVVAVVAVFGGFLGGPARPTATPQTAEASSTPTATAAGPTSTRTPRPTRRPTPRPTAPPEPTDEATPEPTDTPLPIPTNTPKPTASPTPSASPTPPFPSAYVCDGSLSFLTDPFTKNWQLYGWHWGDRGKFDRVWLTLNRAPGGTDSAQAVVTVVDPTTLEVDHGFPQPPADVDKVILVGLYPSVNFNGTVDESPGRRAVRSLYAREDAAGTLYVALGVAGKGCYSLQAPAWTAVDPKKVTSVDVIIDIKH